MLRLTPYLPNAALAEVRAWLRGREALDVNAAPVYLSATLLAAFCLVAGFFLGFTIERSFVTSDLLVLGFFLSIAIAARWIGFARLAGALECIALFSAASVLAIIASIIIAALNHAMVDEALAWSDAALFHLSSESLTAAMRTWPLAFSALRPAYDSLTYQPFLLILGLCAVRQGDNAWRFTFAWCLAMIVCIAISPLFPAYGNPPYAYDWRDVFDGTRDGSLRMIRRSDLTGIITFPSFHVAGAIVLAWGSATIRVVRVPMLILNAIVVVSAVPIGGHYVIDVIAGIAVAALAIVAAPPLTRSCLRLLARTARQSRSFPNATQQALARS